MTNYYDSLIQDMSNAQARFSTMDPSMKPDNAARSFQLEKFSGKPAETIGGDPQKFDDEYQSQLRQQVVAGNPDLTDFVNAHPLHAQLIKDDLPALDRVTSVARSIAERQTTDDRARNFAADFKAKNPGWEDSWDAILEGFFRARMAIQRGVSTAAGGRSAEQITPSRYEEGLGQDVLNLNLGSAFAKTAYRLSNAFPSALPSFLVGAGVTAATENPLAGVVAGGLSIGAFSGLQTLGEQFQKEIASTPEDPEGAYNRAVRTAEIGGAFSGIGWGLFPFRFLNGPVKSILFQIFGVQPAVGGIHRILEGMRLSQDMNLGPGYVEDVIGSAIPLLLMEGVGRGRYALRPGTPFRPYREGGPGFEVIPPEGEPPTPSPAGRLERPASEGLVLGEEEGPTDMTRRGFLQGAGAVTARAALPRLPKPVDITEGLHPDAINFAEEYFTNYRGELYKPIYDKAMAVQDRRNMATWYSNMTPDEWESRAGYWEMNGLTREDLIKAYKDAGTLIDRGFDGLQAQARALDRWNRTKSPIELWNPQQELQVKAEAQQADENKQIIDSAVKEGEKTQIKAIAPEKFNELMAKLPSQDLHIRTEALAKLYNELVKNPNDYIMGLIDKLRYSGGYGVISTPSARYIANIPQDIHKNLSDDIALGDDMSPNDVKELEGIKREPQEHVFLPAIQVGGQVFEGNDHGEAYDQAIQAMQGQEVTPESVQEGYTTTHGRFVDPSEALAIAKQMGQLRANATSVTGLQAEDLHPIGAKAQSAQLGREIRDRLIHTYGMDEKLAKDYGTLIGAYYYRRAIDTGMSPEYLYVSDGLRFGWGEDDAPIIGQPFRQDNFRVGKAMLTQSLEKLMARSMGGSEWVQVPEKGEGGMGLYWRYMPSMQSRQGTLRMPSRLTIANVNFDEAMRGAGAFTAYFQHIEELAREKGIDEIHLENIENDRLIPFYERRGYAIKNDLWDAGLSPSMVKTISRRQRQPGQGDRPRTPTTFFGDLLKQAGFDPQGHYDAIWKELQDRKDFLYTMLSDLLESSKDRDAFYASPFRKQISDNINRLDARQEELDRILQIAMQPLGAYDKIWYNYAQYMTRQEFLESETLWGSSAEAAEKLGIPQADAFSVIANEMFSRMGEPANMTPQAARVEMARQRGMRLLQPSNPAGVRGDILLKVGDNLIRLFEGEYTTDTLAHEFFHLWSHNIFHDAIRPGASVKSIDLRDDILEWLGYKRGQFTDPQQLTYDDNEKAADAGLIYLMEGKAPSLALMKVFENFKERLVDTYRDASALGLPIPDSVRNVFAKIIATDEEMRRMTEVDVDNVDFIRQNAGLNPPPLPDIPYRLGQQLEAKLKNPALRWEILAQDPLVQEFLDLRSALAPTSTEEQARNPAWRAGRRYVIDGKAYRGNEAIPKLYEKTAEFAKGQIRQEKILTVVVGPPGAGKTTVVKPRELGGYGLAQALGARVIDVDDMRSVIPEYAGGAGLFATLAEGQGLTQEVMLMAVRNGDNIIHPIIGANPAQVVQGIKQRLDSMGYTLKVLHVGTDANTAVRRVISRFVETGRIVQPEYVAEATATTPETYERLKVYANEAAAIDTTQFPPTITDGADTTLADIIRSGSGSLASEDVSGLLPETGAERGQEGQAPQAPSVGRRFRQDNLFRKAQEAEEAFRTILKNEAPQLDDKTIDFIATSVRAIGSRMSPRRAWDYIRRSNTDLPANPSGDFLRAAGEVASAQDEFEYFRYGRGEPRRFQQPPLPPGPPTPPADGAGEGQPPTPTPALPFTEGAAFGRTQRMYRQYMRMIHQRDIEDVQWRREKAQKIIERMNSREWEDYVIAHTPEVEAEVRSRPEVGIYDDLVKRKFKIGIASVDEATRAQLPAHWFSANGIAADDVAHFYGYDNGDELLAVLTTMRRITEGFQGNIITRLTKATVYQNALEALGPTQADRLDEATDHALSLTQMELIHERILQLGQEIGAGLPMSKEAVAWGVKALVDRENFRRTKATRYLRESGREARQMEQFHLNGDLRNAFIHAQGQYVALLKAKLATEIEKDVKRLQKLVKTFSKREVTGVQQEFTNWIHFLLNYSGFHVRDPMDVWTEIRSHDEQDLNRFVLKKQAEGIPIMIAPELLDPSYFRNYDDMTVLEARQLLNAVRSLAKSGREVKKIVVSGDKRDLNETIDNFIDQINTLREDFAPDYRRRSVKQLSRTYLAVHLQMESLFNRWAYGKAFGDFNLFLRDMIEAANYESSLDAEIGNAYRKLPAYSTSQLNQRVQNNLFKDPREAWTPTSGHPAGTWDWTKATTPIPMYKRNVLAVLLNAGNPDNLERLATGFGLQPQQVINWLFRVTNKRDWDWAQKHGDIFAKLKGLSDKMYRRLNDIAPESVPLFPIQTPWGVYKGWYHPIVHDSLFFGDFRENLSEEGLFAKEYVRAGTANAYTKDRTNYRGPLELELDAIPGRLRQEIHDIAFREAVLHTAKVFGNARFKNAVALKYGREYADNLMPWLKYVANGAVMNDAAQRTFMVWADFARQNIMGTLIGFNPRTVQKHATTAAGNSIMEVGGKDFLRAMASLYLNPVSGLSNWRFAMNSSLELQRRHQHFMETVSGAFETRLPIRSLLPAKLDAMRKFILHAGTLPVSGSDLATAVPVWLAAYTQVMEGRNIEYNEYRAKQMAKIAGENRSWEQIINMSGVVPRPGDAIYFADRAVRRAHGSTAVTNRPPIMQGGALQQWITSFYVFFNHIAQRQYELAWRARVASGKSTSQEAIDGVRKGTSFIAGIFFYVIFLAMVEAWVTPRKGEHQYKQDSWAEKAWDATADLALSLSASWVGVRDFVHSVLGGGDPNLGLLGTPISAGRDLYRDIADHKSYDPKSAGKIIKHANTAIGVATGLSNAEIGNMMRYVYDLEHGNAHPQNEGDWWRGMTKGEERPREDRPDMVERFLRAIGKDKPYR